jgi:hypothetical protein
MNLHPTPPSIATHRPPSSTAALDVRADDEDDEGDGRRFLQRLRAGASAHPSDGPYPTFAGMALACAGGLLAWYGDDSDTPDPASLLALALTEQRRG